MNCGFHQCLSMLFKCYCIIIGDNVQKTDVFRVIRIFIGFHVLKKNLRLSE